MKLRIVLLVMIAAMFGCEGHAQKGHDKFKSERVSKTASFVVDANIDVVFPLFGAFEERKWAEGWAPTLVYPEQEIIEEGTTFKVDGHGHEHESLWIVTKYDRESSLIQYLVSTEGRFWMITVKCTSIEGSRKTRTEVTYTYTGLSAKGNELNRQNLHHIFQNNLQDWAGAINDYLNE